MKKKNIRISPQDLSKVKALLKEGQKVGAIKHARNCGQIFPGNEKKNNITGENEISHRVGLREAKDAVEWIMGTRANPTAKFTSTLKIKKVIVEGETGDIELDIDELQLRCLDGLSQGIPLSEVSAMAELVMFIRKWQGAVLKEE